MATAAAAHLGVSHQAPSTPPPMRSNVSYTGIMLHTCCPFRLSRYLLHLLRCRLCQREIWRRPKRAIVVNLSCSVRTVRREVRPGRRCCRIRKIWERALLSIYMRVNDSTYEVARSANQPVVEMVRWAVISPTHQDLNPGARIISGFISGFSGMHFQWEETFPSTTRRLR